MFKTTRRKLGEFAQSRHATLPIGAAMGGMVVPALIYAAINRVDAAALKGWAIPAATDIAFALAVLSLLGARVPVSLKVAFLVLPVFALCQRRCLSAKRQPGHTGPDCAAWRCCRLGAWQAGGGFWRVMALDPHGRSPLAENPGGD